MSFKLYYTGNAKFMYIQLFHCPCFDIYDT